MKIISEIELCIKDIDFIAETENKLYGRISKTTQHYYNYFYVLLSIIENKLNKEYENINRGCYC